MCVNEKLLLVGLIAALPIAIFGMISRVTGNKILGYFIYKLPSLIVLIISIVYFLKLSKLI